eukprot:562138_1
MAGLANFLGQLGAITTVLNDQLNDVSQHEMDDAPPSDIVHTECEHISTCDHLKALGLIMNEYKSKQLDMDKVNATKVLDDFHHLLTLHSDDDAFEAIFDTLGGYCDATACAMFRGNNRNRNGTTDSDNSDQKEHSTQTTETVIHQLLDKFHCHFVHCYDIGNRLNRKARDTISKQVNNSPNDSTTAFIATQRVVTAKKHSEYRQIRAAKYYLKDTTPQDVNDTMQHTPDNDQKADDTRYHIGLKFTYNYSPGKHMETDMAADNASANTIELTIKQKYKSFKEEMTQNAIQTLTMQQFINEHHKASIHLNSRYCRRLKARLRKKVQQVGQLGEQQDSTMDSIFGNFGNMSQHNPEFKDEYGNMLIRTNLSKTTKDSVYRQMVKSHLLAVILYCNYDALSYEFSATYRPQRSHEWMASIMERHSNFWWFGKWIKECVNWFGAAVNECRIDTFYHGIGMEMLVPYNGFNINGPLSTSVSLCVAVNFANNQGLIVELEGRHDSQKKCFSCSWLSDYSNEREYLFVQHRDALSTCNIVHCQTGTEYKEMLCALKHLNTMTFYYGNDSAERVAATLVEYALNKRPDRLKGYGKRIWNAFCDEMDVVDISDLEHMTQWIPRLRELFLYSNKQWIRMDHILTLYPNLEQLRVRCIEMLTVWMMEDVLKQ